MLSGNNYEAPLSQFSGKATRPIVRIINNAPFRDHITPHYVNLGLINLPAIIKLRTCRLFYEHFANKKSI